MGNMVVTARAPPYAIPPNLVAVTFSALFSAPRSAAIFFTPKALHPSAQGCSHLRTTLGHEVIGFVYADGVTQVLWSVFV